MSRFVGEGFMMNIIKINNFRGFKIDSKFLSKKTKILQPKMIGVEITRYECDYILIEPVMIEGVFREQFDVTLFYKNGDCRKIKGSFKSIMILFDIWLSRGWNYQNEKPLDIATDLIANFI